MARVDALASMATMLASAPVDDAERAARTAARTPKVTPVTAAKPLNLQRQ